MKYHIPMALLIITTIFTLSVCFIPVVEVVEKKGVTTNFGGDLIDETESELEYVEDEVAE